MKPSHLVISAMVLTLLSSCAGSPNRRLASVRDDDEDPRAPQVVSEDEARAEDDSEPKPDTRISEATRKRLFELRRTIRTWAYECPDGSLTGAGCPMGDMNEFAGMLCLSGEEKRCEDVRRSQDPVTGEWYRSPGLVGIYDGKGWATFSRDMAKGAWAYAVAKKDSEAARKWLEFIASNDWKLCRKSEEGWDACATRATFWTTAKVISDYLGLKKNKKMKKYKFLIEKIYGPVEASVQPQDYPMMLTANMLLIRKEIEKRTGKKDPSHRFLNQASRILHRRAPDNPIFRYLAKGADEEGARLIERWCKATPPENTPYPPGRDWIWQRSIKDTLDGTNVQTWQHPNGHECIWAINLLIGPDPVQEYTGPRRPWSRRNNVAPVPGESQP